MFSRKLLDKELLGIGFDALSPLLYQRRVPEAAIDQLLSFRLIGIYRWEIEGSIGLRHEPSQAFAKEQLRRFGGNFWQWALSQPNQPLFSVRGPVSNVANWSNRLTLDIRHLTPAQAAARIRNDIAGYVLPLFQAITSLDKFYNVLIEDEDPFRWHFSSPLLRIGQVIILTKQLHRPHEIYRGVVERERKILQGQLRDVCLDEFLSAIEVAAETDGVLDVRASTSPAANP